MAERKRPEKRRASRPAADVVELQDPKQTESDFLRDLERASTDRAKERLAKAAKRSRPG